MDQRLHQAWHARQRASPIYPVPYLAPEGLVLGAGTVLIPARGARRLASLDRQEARVLALLSAAYGKAVAVEVLGNIAGAADAWRQGDDCLAYIHLAHSRLSFAMSGAKSSAAFCRTAPSRSTLPRSPPIWRKMISRNCVRHRVLTGPVAAREAETTKTT